jgi:hypothetical protein
MHRWAETAAARTGKKEMAVRITAAIPAIIRFIHLTHA